MYRKWRWNWDVGFQSGIWDWDCKKLVAITIEQSNNIDASKLQDRNNNKTWFLVTIIDNKNNIIETTNTTKTNRVLINKLPVQKLNLAAKPLLIRIRRFIQLPPNNIIQHNKIFIIITKR